MRDRRLFKKYGLTQEDIDTLLAAQGFRCAICRVDFTKIAGRQRGYHPYVVDHDSRKEGKESVRGLLCDDCNLVLGLAKENPSILRRAAQYLDLHTLRWGLVEVVAA